VIGVPERSWTVTIDGVDIAVTAKRVRHLRLVVHPDGRVRASVPLRTSRRTADEFLRGRIAWVRAQQTRLRASGVTPKPLVDGGTVRLWGDDVPLRVVRGHGGGRLTADAFTVAVADPADAAAVGAAVAALYRREIKAVLDDIVAKWSAKVGCAPRRVTLRTMRTRWGSCTPATGAIRLNPELAARHPRCLNYVVLHEMVHLIQPGHGPAFQSAMGALLPGWRDIRSELNGRAS